MTCPFAFAVHDTSTSRRLFCAPAWLGLPRYSRFFLGIVGTILLALPILAQPDDETTLEAPDKESPTITNTGGTTARPAGRSRRSRTSYEDVTQIGSNLVIGEGEHVNDAVVLHGDVQIDGSVHGDLVVVLGNVRLGPKARISRDLVVILGAVTTDPDAVVGGDRVVLGIDSHPRYRMLAEQAIQWFHSGPLWFRPLPLAHGWSWLVAAVILLIYALLAALFPGTMNACVQRLELQPGRAFLTGLLALSLFIPLMFLLTVMVIGIPLIPVVAVSMLAAFIFGKAAVYSFAGQRIGGQFGVALLHNPLLALIAGGLLFCLLYTVPVIGVVAWCAIAPLSVGAVVLAFAQRFQRTSPTPVEPPALEGGAIAGPALWPRVGFWRRLLATLLDLVLVGAMEILFHDLKLFLPLWVLYHIAMWTWKGTTIGGVVVGLKIVRTDGSSANFAVALVRSLASFLSAAVFFLGFFWAGWSRDKQAWHDRIAGTIVVRTPKGTALV